MPRWFSARAFALLALACPLLLAPLASADSQPSSCSRPGAVTVRTPTQLAYALRSLRPGGTVLIAAGTYRGHFSETASGTSTNRIAICGPRTAILDGGSVKSGYGLHVQGDFVDLVGFTVRRSMKGIMLDGASDAVLDNLAVQQIGDEAIHLRSGSIRGRVSNSDISYTGLRVKSYGEGVYIGSSSSHWCTLTSCVPDQSSSAVIVGNTFHGLGAEAVDAKEGTRAGVITGNVIDGTGSGAYSLVDIKGNGYEITGNRGANARRDGMSVSVALEGWGLGNTFDGNQLDVEGPGYGIRVPDRNTVRCDNVVTDATLGLSNVACS